MVASNDPPADQPDDAGCGVDSDILDDLLAEWVERRESGEDVNIEDICGTRHEAIEPLRALVEKLEQTAWLVGSPDADAAGQSTRNACSLAEFLVGRGADSFLDQILAEEIVPARAVEELRESAGDIVEVAKGLLERGATPFQLRCVAGRDPIPLRFGDYVLVESLGVGGMGRVFKAYHQTMDRFVAIKLIRPSILNADEILQRFRREVRTVARLNHPGIVTAYDAGMSPAGPYLAMEFVDGVDLATLLRRNGPLAVDQAIEYVRQAASALAHAHAEEVVHRDVKPSNLLVSANGVVKVTDLGLARPATDGAENGEITGDGRVIGTIDYLAPEQAVDCRNADARSDVYALGCMLYALIHGRPAHHGESVVNRLLAHQSGETPDLSSGRDDIPSDLNRLFCRMVAPRPDDRVQTMDEVVQALDAIGAGLPLPTPGRRRWRWIAGLGAIAIVMAAVVLHGITTHRAVVTSEPTNLPTVPMAPESVEESRPGQPVSPPPLVVPFTPSDAATSQEAWAEHLGLPVEFENSIGMRFRLIPPGEFFMGSTEKEMQPFLENEEPGNYWWRQYHAEIGQHATRITLPFYMGAFEVTQGEYKELSGRNPAYFRAPDESTSNDLPVEQVTWFDSVHLCNAACRRDGLDPVYEIVGESVRLVDGNGYQLPTEACWEFACRSGSEAALPDVAGTRFPGDHGWIRGTADGRTHRVGLKPPNGFGLHDMIGNVHEWCWDRFGPYEPDVAVEDPFGPEVGDLRCLRGRSWDNGPFGTRAAARSSKSPDSLGNSIGVRLVLPIDGVRALLR